VDDLIARLRVGAGEAKILHRESTAALLHQAAEALEAAEARSRELTNALRDLLDVSDSLRTRTLDIALTQRTLAKARGALSSPAPPPASTELTDEDVIKAMYAKTMNILRDGG
jgi:outer membrane protein TolC